jgi:rod shape determining protein RodA
VTRRGRELLLEFDWHLLAVALVLAMIGVAFVWSTTRGDAEQAGLAARQLLYVGAALPLVALLVRIPYPSFARLAAPLYLLMIAVLVFLLARRGGDVRETQAWIRLPMGFGLQPSEFGKLAVILIVAAYLRYRGPPRRALDLVGPFALAGFPMLLIAKQPDLGSALTLVPVVFAMVYAAGARARTLCGIVLVGALLGAGLFFSPAVKSYQRERVQSFLVSIPDKTLEARALRAGGQHEEARKVERELRKIKREGGFQVYHSMVSIGSGGALGKGLGKGPHNRLDYLPERHNDFLFAVIGEEWGFFGCSLVLGLHLLLLVLIVAVAARTRDSFGRLLCVGIATLLAFQTFLNTGVATGLLPVTGVTLPFLSFGGSSLLASFAAVATVLNVGAHRVTTLAGETFHDFALGEA